jgi:hypothetical protein
MQSRKLHRKRFFKAPSSNTQVPKKLQLSITNQDGKPMRMFWLEVSLDIVSLEFRPYEILLAGETGTIFILVVGLSRRRPDELDGRAQLRCAK